MLEVFSNGKPVNTFVFLDGESFPLAIQQFSLVIQDVRPIFFVATMLNVKNIYKIHENDFRLKVKCDSITGNKNNVNIIFDDKELTKDKKILISELTVTCNVDDEKISAIMGYCSDTPIPSFSEIDLFSSLI